MAVRTGAGTGVIVSLVVFVLTTIFLLVLTIVFYAGKQSEAERRDGAERALAKYVKSGEQSTDAFQAHEAAAQGRAASVAGYLHEQNRELKQFVGGDAGAPLDAIRQQFAPLGVGANAVVLTAMQDMRRDLTARQGEIDSLRTQMQRLDADLAEKQAQLDQAAEAHEQQLADLRSQVQGYIDAAEEYRARLDEAIAELNRAEDRMRDRYEGQIADLREENEELDRELVLMRGRVDELEERISRDRIRAQDPALLTDGRVIEVAGASEQVFIDRGRQHRIVLGMTFEVYDGASPPGVDQRTGALLRGKASLQVIKVGETTSTGKLTRSVPGRPVVPQDIIANAVYDPEFRFKFLVHGKFDLDGNGQPSEAEAEFLRSMVIEWGGEVIIGETLPGDLDFLVLGVEPPMPMPLPPHPTPEQLDGFIRKRRDHEQYQTIFRHAREAQIPVLNENRFKILTGWTNR